MSGVMIGSELGMATTGPIRRSVVIIDPAGLHIRPAVAFAKNAAKCRSAITVWNGEKRADGKSAQDLILLFAMSGTELTVEIDGEDAHTAIEPLLAILATPGYED